MESYAGCRGAAPVRVGFVLSVRLCRRTPCRVNGQRAQRFRAATDSGLVIAVGAIRLHDRSQPARAGSRRGRHARSKEVKALLGEPEATALKSNSC